MSRKPKQGQHATPLSDADREQLAEIRKANAQIEQQALRVADASRRAASERKTLKELEGRLRDICRSLPLLEQA